jgi:hypothetical protein
MVGFGPTTPASKAGVLPLNYIGEARALTTLIGRFGSFPVTAFPLLEGGLERTTFGMVKTYGAPFSAVTEAGQIVSGDC